jgi:hypothetical protein
MCTVRGKSKMQAINKIKIFNMINTNKLNIILLSVSVVFFGTLWISILSMLR